MNVLVHYVASHGDTTDTDVVARKRARPPCGARPGSNHRVSVFLTKVTCRTCLAWIADWTVARCAELARAETQAPTPIAPLAPKTPRPRSRPVTHFRCGACFRTIARGAEGWRDWTCPVHPAALIISVCGPEREERSPRRAP